MELSHNTATFMVLFVTFLWGSWYQVVKHTGNYPIYALLSWMYLFSIFIVWGAIAFLHTSMVPHGVFHEMASDLPRTMIIFICGAFYAIGMQLQLSVVSKVGLILSSSITSTCSILSGIVVSAVLGGISEGSSIIFIILAAVLLICGTIVCQISGVMRDKNNERNHEPAGEPGRNAVNSNLSEENKNTHRARSCNQDIAMLIFTSAVLIPLYSVACSIGLGTELRPDGFSSLTCMGILCIGALAGTSLYTAYKLTKERKWNIFLKPDRGMVLILLMACIAAFCHFGGNVLHSIAAPVVSVVIATGIGYSFGMWSYLWGLIYGEFKGAGKRTFGVLGTGIALFITGVAILTMNIAS